jgi:hypothetical protein
MVASREQIRRSTENVLAALPAVREAWDQEDCEIAENTIQALLDQICGLQGLKASARRLVQIEKRALARDAKRAGDNG